jgi:PWI domain
LAAVSQRTRNAERARGRLFNRLDDLSDDVARRIGGGSGSGSGSNDNSNFEEELRRWEQHERRRTIERAGYERMVALHTHDAEGYERAARHERSLYGSAASAAGNGDDSDPERVAAHHIPTLKELHNERREWDEVFEGRDSEWYQRRQKARDDERRSDKRERRRDAERDLRAARAMRERVERKQAVERERADLAREIVERDVPESQADVFAFQVDWAEVERGGAELRAKLTDFVRSKVANLLGSEDDALIDHILRSVDAHSSASTLAASLRSVLEDEASTLVIRLWRFVIFETIFARRLRERRLVGE